MGASGGPAAAMDGRAGRMVGRVYFWQGGSLWVGTGRGRTDFHDHHAHQIAVSLGGQFAFRTEANGAWTNYTGAVIPSHRRHEFEVEGPLAHLFVEPETLEGRALAARFAGEGITAIPERECRLASSALETARHGMASDEEVIAVARSAIAALARVSSPDAPIDPRVTKAIAYLRKRVGNPSTLGEAASVATLSPSRFRHLFVQETGTSFRAYILWLRLNVAIRAAMAGESWTTAAHEAGFADSAHLGRTFKRMFGISPGTLVAGER